MNRWTKKFPLKHQTDLYYSGQIDHLSIATSPSRSPVPVTSWQLDYATNEDRTYEALSTRSSLPKRNDYSNRNAREIIENNNRRLNRNSRSPIAGPSWQLDSSTYDDRTYEANDSPVRNKSPNLNVMEVIENNTRRLNRKSRSPVPGPSWQLDDSTYEDRTYEANDSPDRNISPNRNVMETIENNTRRLNNSGDLDETFLSSFLEDLSGDIQDNENDNDNEMENNILNEPEYAINVTNDGILPKRDKRYLQMPKKLRAKLNKEWKWPTRKPKKFKNTQFEFTVNNVGPTKSYSASPSPYEILKTFHTPNILEFIATETNKEGRKKKNSSNTEKGKGRYVKFEDVSVHELLLVDAVQILQGIVHFPHIQHFWSKDSIFDYSYVRNIMPRDRFLQIYGSLHFSDIISAAEAGDRLYKIRHLIKMYKENFLENYIPDRELSVDESLELWDGRRLGFRVNIPNKACQNGIEAFLICEASSSYCMDFEYWANNPVEIYDNVNLPNTDLTYFSVWSKIVLHLMLPYLNKGYTIGMDSLYTDPRLYEVLIKNNTDAVGTVRYNRILMPQGITDPLEMGKTKIWYKLITAEKGISCLTWQDKKRVNMLSTYHDATVRPVRDKQGGEGATKLKPLVCIDYRRAMSGVDVNDQIRATYTIARKKRKKYYKKMYATVLDKAIFNSWVVYNKLPQVTTKLSFLNFKIVLVKQMVQENNHQYVQTRDGPRLPITHPDKRFTPGHHFPEIIGYEKVSKRPIRRVCIVCNYQSEKSEKRAQMAGHIKSHLRCIVCKEVLCDAPCFYIYHTEVEYLEYQKKLNRAMRNSNNVDNEEEIYP